MTDAPATTLPTPAALDTVRALAAFVKARTEEGAQQLLDRIPRALGQAAELDANGLERELLGEQPDDIAVRLLWRTLLNTAQPFHAHPDVPEGAREALAAAAPV